MEQSWIVVALCQVCLQFVTNETPGLGGEWRRGRDYGHCVARSANDVDAARTTQNRCPVGASMTHQVLTACIRLAPNVSSRRTSASISSVSISRCTRLACTTSFTLIA